MSICESWVYNEIDPTKWAEIQKLCREKYDIQIVGNEGETRMFGVTVHYKFCPDTKIGEMTVLKKTPILPCKTIKKVIDEVFYSI